MLDEQSYRNQLRQGFMGRMQYKVNVDENGGIAPNQQQTMQAQGHMPSLPQQQVPRGREEQQPCELTNCYSPMSLGGDADRALYPPLKCPVLKPYRPHAADVMHVTTKVSDRLQEQTYEMELRKMDDEQYPIRYVQDDLRQRHMQHQQQVRQVQQRITSRRLQDQALGFQMAYQQQDNEEVGEGLQQIKQAYMSQRELTGAVGQQPIQQRVGHENVQDGTYYGLKEMEDRYPPEQMRKRSARKVNQVYSKQQQMNQTIAEQRLQDRMGYEKMQYGVPCKEDLENRQAREEKMQDCIACEDLQHRVMGDKRQERLLRKNMQQSPLHEELQDRPTREDMADRSTREDMADRSTGRQEIQHCPLHEEMQDRVAVGGIQDRLLRERMHNNMIRDHLEREALQNRMSYEERHHQLKQSKQNCQQPQKQDNLEREEMQGRYVPNPQYLTQPEMQTGKEMGDDHSPNSNQMSQRPMQERLPQKELHNRFVQKHIQEHSSLNSPEDHLKQQTVRENYEQQRMQDRYAQEYSPQDANQKQQLDETFEKENMHHIGPTTLGGFTPKGMPINREVELAEDQMNERGAQDRKENNETAKYSSRRIKEGDEPAARQLPIEAELEHARTQSPNSQIFVPRSMRGSRSSLTDSQSIRTVVSKGTAHNLRKIVRSHCKLHEVIDSALKNLNDKDKEHKDDKVERNSQKYDSQQTLATQSSDFTDDEDDIPLPPSRMSQNPSNATPKPQVPSRAASNAPNTPQPVASPGAFLCRCASAEPNSTKKHPLAHLEPPPSAHVPHLCDVMQEMSKSEFMDYRTGEPLDLSFDDVVQSKVITPIVTKLQQMYLHSLQNKVTAMLELQTLPQRVQEVYKASKVLRSGRTCKEIQQAPQPN